MNEAEIQHLVEIYVNIFTFMSDANTDPVILVVT